MKVSTAVVRCYDARRFDLEMIGQLALMVPAGLLSQQWKWALFPIGGIILISLGCWAEHRALRRRYGEWQRLAKESEADPLSWTGKRIRQVEREVRSSIVWAFIHAILLLACFFIGSKAWAQIFGLWSIYSAILAVFKYRWLGASLGSKRRTLRLMLRRG